MSAPLFTAALLLSHRNAEKYLLAFGRGKVEANATAAGCLFATAGRIFSEQIFSEQQKYRVSLITDQPGDRSEISAVACAHF